MQPDDLEALITLKKGQEVRASVVFPTSENKFCNKNL